MTYKSQKQLAEENPSGMDRIDNPHNFSSNPGFLSTDGMLTGSSPMGGGVARGSTGTGPAPKSIAPRGSLRQAPVGGPSHSISPFNGR
jgi:hypothetical protein